MPSSKSPPYVIHPSPTHGRGVFATQTIRKGARIVQYRGARLPSDVADNRPASDSTDPYHTLLFKLHDGTVLDASQGGNAARWINHGCDPNCEAIEYDDGRVFIVTTTSKDFDEAMKAIRPGPASVDKLDLWVITPLGSVKKKAQ